MTGLGMLVMTAPIFPKIPSRIAKTAAIRMMDGS